MKHNLFIAVLFFGYIFCAESGSAQTNAPYSATLFGSEGDIYAGKKDTVTDMNFISFSGDIDTVYGIKDYVTLCIDEESGVYLSEDFSLTVHLFIRTTAASGVKDTFSRSLTIDYKKDSGSYTARRYFEFSDAVAFSIEITGIDSNVTWAVTRAVKLESRIAGLRDWHFDCSATVGFLSSAGVMDNEWAVMWEAPQNGYNEFDFEWAWIDESAVADYSISPGVFNLAKIFEHNASRVTLSGSSYKIPLLYDGDGRIFARVRPAQVRVSGRRVEGKWAYKTNADTALYVSYSGFERSLNWQATTGFSEDGKRKSVVQFFDGTLRGRQTVTKDNTTDTTIIAESFYDYQGRPVISVLPAPSISSMIGFVKGFNQFDDNEISKSAYDRLDVNSTACAQVSLRLSTLTGAGRYYSENNPLRGTGYHRYIADANGYAYTEQRYSADGTGRLDARGGVGEVFQINTPDAYGRQHDTKYFYASAFQEELDGLFGSDAGVASHYFKNLVRDANGQYSVSYVDMQGRTVATALAGEPPPGMDTLPSYPAAVQEVTQQLIDPHTNRVNGMSVVTTKSIVAPRGGTYSFAYSFSPENFKQDNCDSVTVCYDCLYAVTISIYSDCSGIFSSLGFTNPVIKRNFTPGVFIDTCRQNGLSPAITDSFSVWLPEGSYTVVKELKLSGEARDYYRDSIFMINNSCKSLQAYIDTQYTLITAQQHCNVTCESCSAQVGTYEDFEDKFRAESGLPDSVIAMMTEQIQAAYHEALGMCERICLNETPDGFDEIRSIREIMLIDVSPTQGGQYAQPANASLPLSIFRPVQIPWISATTDEQPFRHPSVDVPGQPYQQTPYADAYGFAHAINNTLPSVTPDQFSRDFESQFAEQLLVYHPEYCKLHLLENNLRPAFRFAQMLEDTDTWADAVSRGYVYDLLNKDSFYLSSGMAGWSYRSAMQTAMNINFQTRTVGVNTQTLSMWQMAQMMVFCRVALENHAGTPGGSTQVINCLTSLSQGAPVSVSGYCTNDLNMVWRIFKSLYLTFRRSHIDTYLNAQCPGSAPASITGAYSGYVPRFSNISFTSGVLNTGYPEIDDYVNSTDPNANITMMAQQADSSCRANAGNWINKLRMCEDVNSYIAQNPVQWQSDSVHIVANLVGICRRGVDYPGHPFGASTLPDGVAALLDDDALTGQYYSSFPEVIRYFLEQTAHITISESCHPYLVDFPAPYQSAPPLTEQQIITKPSECECARIDGLKGYYEQWQNQGYTGTFSDYLLIEHGAYLSADSIQFFMDLCHDTARSCAFLEGPVVLPAVFRCSGTSTSESGCIDCNGFTLLKEEFAGSYGFSAPVQEPQTKSDININRFFAAFANFKTGFGYTWVNYADFDLQCSSAFGDCAALDSALQLFYQSPQYYNGFFGDSCKAAFTGFMNNFFGVYYTFEQWLAEFNEVCNYVPDVCQPTLTCPGFHALLDSFYFIYGTALYQHANATRLFTVFMNDRLQSSNTFSYYESIYQNLCGCKLTVGQFPDCYLLGTLYTHFYDSVRTLVPPPDEQTCKALFTQSFISFFNADASIPWQEIETMYHNCSDGGCVPDIDQLCAPQFNCDVLKYFSELLESEYGGTLSTYPNCIDIIVSYFNNHFNLNYTYAQIVALFNQYDCAAFLPQCDNAYNCTILQELVNTFRDNEVYTQENCKALFESWFNDFYGTALSFEDIQQIYTEEGCGELTLCEEETLIYGCWQIEELLNAFLSSYPTPVEVFGSAGGCEEAFRNYFNNAFNTNFSYATIKNYFLVLCQIELNICESQCADIEIFTTGHTTRYGSMKMPAEAHRRLFTYRYNEQYLHGGSLSVQDVMDVLETCNLLPALRTGDSVSYSLYDAEVLLNLKTTYLLLRSGGLPAGCMGDFASWFNAVTGDSMNYEGIRQLYDFVLGAGSGNVCNPPAQDSVITIGYGPGLNLPAGGPRLCGGNSVVFPPVQLDTASCPDLYEFAVTAAEDKYDLYLDSLRNVFDTAYYNKCMDAGKFESLTVTYSMAQYHYTLYYYDQAGNLVATVPPAGVDNRQGDASFLQSVAAKRSAVLSGADESANRAVPNHSLITAYRYNTLNEVVAQRTPDAGESKFYYDVLGRLAVSQNAKQQVTNGYSYTLYDILGRIKEVGAVTNAAAMTNTTAKNPTSLASWLTGKPATDITRTGYDVSYFNGAGTLCDEYLCQENLRNRVSYTAVYESGAPGEAAPGGHTAATYYSYDIHGNVEELLQDINREGFAYNMDGPDSIPTGNRFKKIQYNYDLISGKVNEVAYQAGQPDAFYHRYYYDAENRITDVETSRDKVLWEHIAGYDYYRHGPLARIILGQQQVQGLDYAYTLQGWLKGINSTSVGDGTHDMGEDGKAGSPHSFIARDAYGFSLNYFTGDYTPINSAVTPFAGIGTLTSTGYSLFNGNIASSVVNIPKLGEAKIYGYKYDQLNRLTKMDAYEGLNNGTNVFTAIDINGAYKERISYDANGNIQTYLRNGDAARLSMDNMSYTYKANTNQLDKVTDAAPDAAAGDYDKYNDIKQGQQNGNYQYDAIGNLTSDVSEGITNIDWNVYGKIKHITKSGGNIFYTYDAAGNRISKTYNGKSTFYVRDASGNVMSVYVKDAAVNSNHLTQHESCKTFIDYLLTELKKLALYFTP